MTLTEDSEKISDSCFSDAISDKNFSPFGVFSIESRGSIIENGNGEGEEEEEEDDEFYDTIDETQFIEKEIQDSMALPPIPKKRLTTVLEFLTEEDEEKDEDEDEDEEDLEKRETIYEFLKEYEKNEGSVANEDESESSLSQLQKELEPERPQMINLPRRQLSRRSNQLSSLLFNNPILSTSPPNINNSDDSDSMISELTEALTIRTDLSEARFSRIPSMLAQSQDHLKLAKRYKPVPVKCKSKQKSEFTSLLLIQELNRSEITSSAAAVVQRNSSVNSNRSTTSSLSTSSSQPATDPSKAIFSLTFSPDGHFLAAAGAEGIIKIWSLLQGIDQQPVATIFESEPIRILKGHSAEILDCAWSTNNFLLTASMDKTVRLWHHSRPDALGIFQHLDYVTSVAFHPRDPRIFVSGSLDCKLRLWSIQDRSIINWNELPPGNFITAVAFSRSGTSVIAGTSGGTALIFDTEGLRYNTQILVRSSRSKSVGKKITSITPVPGQFENDERVNKKTKRLRFNYPTL